MSATTELVALAGQAPRQRRKRFGFDVWTVVSLVLLLIFGVFLVYPLWGVFQQSVIDAEGNFSFDNFARFFTNNYYFVTIRNSFAVSFWVTVASLAVAIPFSYFYTYFRIKGARLLFILAVLSIMSAPFIGAYAWILLLGRNGLVRNILQPVWPFEIPTVYGFGGIVFVLTLKLFPLVSVFMNAAFRNVDSSLLEASALMGTTGLKRLGSVILRLTIPTLLAASLLVFMRAFADFGTPLLIGEGFRVFTVEIYNQYLAETGQDHAFASALGIVGILVTTVIFLGQKFVAGRFSFTIKASRPPEKKRLRGLGGAAVYVYMYGLIGLAFLPKIYVIYLSFRNSTQSVFLPGFTLDNYTRAADRVLAQSTWNTLWFSGISLVIIVLISVLIAYLVVRRPNPINNAIDTLAMLPYIMPGAVLAIGLVVAFNGPPLALTGTVAIMVIAMVIRRMPYTIRSATATLMHMPISMEEAARSLGASKMKTFFRVTMPMMSAGIASGAFLSFVTLLTELSAAIILYNNQTITLTMAAFLEISRGNYGLGAAYSSILTVITAVLMYVYLRFTREEDVRL
ncbi:ABC transporter permease [Microbacterium sp. No. 7]|uniref:ABC transporter permease n=1 Tax=Microbacterium sp. No. 7 TaxID=1714373 RepID=UPI0006ED38C4|nr:iron ABC transporter permease [Microbacterium sp. No. 7]ALJ18487.1 iron ABC transporter permease [Microbacterium sp. No. 7]